MSRGGVSARPFYLTLYLLPASALVFGPTASPFAGLPHVIDGQLLALGNDQRAKGHPIGDLGIIILERVKGIEPSS
jgi:hypothetical protein